MESKLQVLKELNSIDNLISIYSTIDMVRVQEVVANKTELESVLMDIMNYENNQYLASIKAANLKVG